MAARRRPPAWRTCRGKWRALRGGCCPCTSLPHWHGPCMLQQHAQAHARGKCPASAAVWEHSERRLRRALDPSNTQHQVRGGHAHARREWRDERRRVRYQAWPRLPGRRGAGPGAGLAGGCKVACWPLERSCRAPNLARHTQGILHQNHPWSGSSILVSSLVKGSATSTLHPNADPCLRWWSARPARGPPAVAGPRASLAAATVGPPLPARPQQPASRGPARSAQHSVWQTRGTSTRRPTTPARASRRARKASTRRLRAQARARHAPQVSLGGTAALNQPVVSHAGRGYSHSKTN